MKLVSACLIGINCTYKGDNNKNYKLLKEFLRGNLFPICPEVLAGLSIPREPAEIVNGTGLDVLKNKAKVINNKGEDITKRFIEGANLVLKIAKALKVKTAILKSKSPSCGCGQIYDGSFSKKLIKGDGVTTALLKLNNIEIINEDEI